MKSLHSQQYKHWRSWRQWNMEGSPVPWSAGLVVLKCLYLRVVYRAARSPSKHQWYSSQKWGKILKFTSEKYSHIAGNAWEIVGEWNQILTYHVVQKSPPRGRRRIQWLRMLAALSEDPSLACGTHKGHLTATCNTRYGNLMLSSGLCKHGHPYVCAFVHVHTQWKKGINKFLVTQNGSKALMWKYHRNTVVFLQDMHTVHVRNNSEWDSNSSESKSQSWQIRSQQTKGPLSSRGSCCWSEDSAWSMVESPFQLSSKGLMFWKYREFKNLNTVRQVTNQPVDKLAWQTFF